MGEIALQDRHFDQAQAAFLQLLDTTPEDPGALEGMARTRRGRGDLEGALAMVPAPPLSPPRACTKNRLPSPMRWPI